MSMLKPCQPRTKLELLVLDVCREGVTSSTHIVMTQLAARGLTLSFVAIMS